MSWVDDWQRGVFPAREPRDDELVEQPAEPLCVAVIGNLSGGYIVYGPFDDYVEAADAIEGTDGWVMRLHSASELSS